MFTRFELSSTSLIAFFVFVFFSGFIFLEARERVRNGMVKTLLGGVIIELGGIIFSSAGVVLLTTTFFVSEIWGTDKLRVQYISSSIICLVIGILLIGYFRHPSAQSKRVLWAGIVTLAVSGYLFYQGLQN